MDDTAKSAVPVKTQLAIYGAGMFANSMSMVAGVVLPLWMGTFHASAFLIGLVLGARHFLPFLLSIHGGSLMDRLGARRVMLVFAVVNMVVPMLFPVLPYVWATIVLQALAGLATSIGWIGAQTLIGQIMRGDPVHAGRLTLSIRLGHFIGPLFAGSAWHLFGPWGAFAAMALWGALGFAASLALPRTEVDKVRREPVRATELMPRLADYVSAFRLMAISTVLFVIVVTMLRNAGNVVQTSFYVIYLDQVLGLSGTSIGVLISAAAVFGAVGALSIGLLLRWIKGHWLLLATVAISVVTVSLTPLLVGFPLLLLASACRGASLGVSQPLMMSTLSRAVDRDVQGKSVGLRNTANRFTGAVVPVVMGLVIDAVGIENGFFIIGGAVVIMLLIVTVWLRHTPSIVGDGKGGQ